MRLNYEDVSLIIYDIVYEMNIVFLEPYQLQYNGLECINMT